jgi:hypothetical protein
MKEIDRRRFARGIFFGAAAVGLALTPSAALAMPFDGNVPGALDDWVQKAQVVVVGPRRRRRRVWRCWWRRGRRVCGWVWV